MLPLIGLVADTDVKDGHVFHVLGDKYARAVAEAGGCLPVAIPALAARLDLDALLDRLDGLVLTGALSNVHPARYGAAESEDHQPFDAARDETALAIIPKALARGMPLLCICRAHQELNVALGGTLATEIQRLEGRNDHRAPEVKDNDVRYGPRHWVDLVPGGKLTAVLGTARLEVNSLHRQAIERLATGLDVEARAEDGTIEAVSVRDAEGFALSVQWHPEYRATENPYSVRLFRTFAEAAHAYRTAARTPQSA